MSIAQRITSALSVQHIKATLTETVRRFPLAMVIAVAGTICSISLIQNDLASDLLARVVWTLVLGFPLIIGIELAIEKYKVGMGVALLLHIAAALFLVVYFLLLPEEINNLADIYLIRALLWAGSFLLLMTFIPLLHRGGTNDEFWHYNMGLLSALLFTVALCTLLVIGIFIGVGTIEVLFQPNFDEHLYPQIWAMVVGIFGATFFLSRIPGGSHGAQQDYRKEFRTLGQYILVPLVVAYFLILYAYSGSVIIDGDWPESIVTYMIIGFSVLGILTSVILHPQRKERKWVQWFVRALYIAVIPQAAVLFWAIWFPLSRYGFTEKRYMVVAFGVWLIAMAVTMLFSKKKDLRLLPLTLAVLMIVVSFGPWGALGMSQRSQLQRLEEVATRAGMIKDGVLQPTEQSVLPEDSKEISNIITYVVNTHGKKALEPLFAPGALDDVSSIYPHEIAQNIVTQELKLNYDYPYNYYNDPISTSNYFNYFPAYEGNITAVTAITGYDYTFTINEPYYGAFGANVKQPPIVLGGTSYDVAVDLEALTITFTPSSGDPITLSFADVVNNLVDTYGTLQREVPSAALNATVETERAKAQLSLFSVSGAFKDDEIKLEQLSMNVYLHIK